MAASRLEMVVCLDKMFKNRYGFRREIGIEKYCGSLITQLLDWKAKGSYIGLLQTDISGAYTNVHHKRLIIAIFELIERSMLPQEAFLTTKNLGF